MFHVIVRVIINGIEYSAQTSYAFMSSHPDVVDIWYLNLNHDISKSLWWMFRIMDCLK